MRRSTTSRCGFWRDRWRLDERLIARKAYDDFQRLLRAHPGGCRKAPCTGRAQARPSAAPAEYAALTMLANQLLNLDEVLNK